MSSFGTRLGSAICFDHCLYREGREEAASSYIIRSSETGSRTIVNFNSLPEMSVGEFVRIADVFTEHGNECWWHFEVRSITDCNTLGIRLGLG
jgi:ketohexokinase